VPSGYFPVSQQLPKTGTARSFGLRAVPSPRIAALERDLCRVAADFRAC
jgi:hypothetical protein